MDTKALLSIMTAATEVPLIADEELDELVILSNNIGMDYAASVGWLWKAGRVSHLYDFSDAQSRFSRDQLHKHCLEMAKQYNKGLVSVQVEIGTETTDELPTV